MSLLLLPDFELESVIASLCPLAPLLSTLDSTNFFAKTVFHHGAFTRSSQPLQRPSLILYNS